MSAVNPIRQPDQCAICFNNCPKKTLRRTALACHHVFHTACIQKWFDQGKVTCPYCRKIVVTSQTSSTQQKIERIICRTYLALFINYSMIAVGTLIHNLGRGSYDSSEMEEYGMALMLGGAVSLATTITVILRHS